MLHVVSSSVSAHPWTSFALNKSLWNIRNSQIIQASAWQAASKGIIPVSTRTDPSICNDPECHILFLFCKSFCILSSLTHSQWHFSEKSTRYSWLRLLPRCFTIHESLTVELCINTVYDRNRGCFATVSEREEPNVLSNLWIFFFSYHLSTWWRSAEYCAKIF